MEESRVGGRVEGRWEERGQGRWQGSVEGRGEGREQGLDCADVSLGGRGVGRDGKRVTEVEGLRHTYTCV